MALQMGNSLFSTRMFSNSPEDNNVLGFDGNTQRPGTPSSFFTSQSQTKNPNLGVNDTTVGTETRDWSNIQDAYTIDGYSSNGWLNSIGERTYYLKLTDYRFTIPAGAIIKGIKVGILRHASSANTMKDYSVKIVKNGIIGATEKAIAGYWPISANQAFAYYGSSTNLWGETWNADEINYDNFGAVVSITNDVVNEEGYVDVITIQVYYSG